MIRFANKEDLTKEFFDLCYEGFLFHYEHRKDIFKNISIDVLKEHVLNQIKNDGLQILLIEENNEIIGYLSYEIKEKVTKSLWIDEFVIKEKYRHNGYGTKLMNQVKEIAIKEKVDRIEFNCWSFNENALKFYRKLGYLEQRIIFELKI